MKLIGSAASSNRPEIKEVLLCQVVVEKEVLKQI